MNEITEWAIFDELQKIARSYAKDFLAGVDPTGTKTFQYGMSDAPVTGGEATARRVTGGVGGLIGGGLAVPSAVGGVIGGVKGYFGGGGVRGAATGFAKGLASPILTPIRAVRASRVLRQAATGAAMRGRDVRSAAKLVGETPGMSSLAATAAKNPRIAEAYLRRMNPEQVASMRGVISKELAGSLAGLGLSGAVGGGSAYMQYAKGRGAGSLMTPEQRRQVMRQ